MPDEATADQTELEQAYQEWDRRATITNFRLACYLGVVLMPAGTLLDHFVYPHQVAEFLKIRLFASVLIVCFLGVLLTPFAYRHYRWLGVALAMLPSSFIALLIYLTDGSNSTYYAGLNLILLVVAFVMHWTFRESLISVFLVIVMYGLACAFNRSFHDWSAFLKHDNGAFVNNLYFLVLTGIIIVTGRYFHSKSRFREFALRFQLDRQYKQLQAAEAQLVQSEKLASLGRMSAGIIHEINNPLNFVKTGLYTLKNKGKHIAPEQQADYADIIKDLEDGFNRVMHIVSSLRGFTHHDGEMVEDVPVAQLVDETLRFVSHEWNQNVQLEKQLAAGQTIAGNKNKLVQVCLNLLENSLGALKSKEFQNGERPTITISSRVENDRNLLSFRDNGPGIKPENLDKIYDPFFTTKDVGEGMGLGLSICYRIMQESGGSIRVQTEPDKFCEFTLEFPVKN